MEVYETRFRSLLKAVSFRVIEIIASTVVLAHFVAVATAVGLAVLLEGMCLVLHYIFERATNRIQWGREIREQDKKGER